MRGDRIRRIASSLAILLAIAVGGLGAIRSPEPRHDPGQPGQVALAPAGIALDTGTFRAESDSASPRVVEPRSSKQRWSLMHGVLGSLVLLGLRLVLLTRRDRSRPRVRQILARRALPRGPPSPQPHLA